MKPIKVLFDKAGNTLNVWFDDPQKEHISEETSEEVILVKDKNAKLIGFEVLNYPSPGRIQRLQDTSRRKRNPYLTKTSAKEAVRRSAPA